jgi:hypothetical protein
MLPKLITSKYILTANNNFASEFQKFVVRLKNARFGGDNMEKGSMSNVIKGVAGGMIAGVAVGMAGKALIDSKPKMKKKANRAINTIGQFVDTAHYLFK